MNRYYISPTDWSSGFMTLIGEEAHHCVRVMRAKVGEHIEIFDGSGRSAVGGIRSLSKDRVELDVRAEKKNPKPKSQIHLYQAIPKGKLMDWIIQKSVELGVASITPIITAHTVVRADDRDARKKQEKWQRIALEACKQCGQNWMPEVGAPASYADVIDKAQGLKIIASLAEERQTFTDLLRSDAAKTASNTYTYLVGPEGDFSADELEWAAEQEFHPVHLGDIVLRVETATMFGLSLLRNASL